MITKGATRWVAALFIIAAFLRFVIKMTWGSAFFKSYVGLSVLYFFALIVIFDNDRMLSAKVKIVRPPEPLHMAKKSAHSNKVCVSVEPWVIMPATFVGFSQIEFPMDRRASQRRIFATQAFLPLEVLNQVQLFVYIALV